MKTSAFKKVHRDILLEWIYDDPGKKNIPNCQNTDWYNRKSLSRQCSEHRNKEAFFPGNRLNFQ